MQPVRIDLRMDRTMNKEDLKSTVVASLFAALIAVGSYLIIPLPFSPVPVVLQNFFILLAGLVLGPGWGAASVAIFLLAGLVGLPVFAGAKGGPAHFLGPTGGYLVSYIPTVVLIGLLAGTEKRSLLRTVTALASGALLILSFGTVWLAVSLRMSLPAAISAGMLPFLPGDAVKIAVAAAVAPRVRSAFGLPVRSGQAAAEPSGSDGSVDRGTGASGMKPRT